MSWISGSDHSRRLNAYSILTVTTQFGSVIRQGRTSGSAPRAGERLAHRGSLTYGSCHHFPMRPSRRRGAHPAFTLLILGTASKSILPWSCVLPRLKNLLYGRSPSMSLVTIILILLILGAFGGGFYGGPTYRTGGFGLGGILIIVLIVLLVTGRL